MPPTLEHVLWWLALLTFAAANTFTIVSNLREIRARRRAFVGEAKLREEVRRATDDFSAKLRAVVELPRFPVSICPRCGFTMASRMPLPDRS